jgi:hypothetical protein
MVDYLALKFEWLAGADSAGLVADLRRLRAARPIDRICPMSGGIIEGAALAGQVMDAAESALTELAARPQRRSFAGFDWKRALGAEALVAIEDLPRPRPVEADAAGRQSA